MTPSLLQKIKETLEFYGSRDNWKFQSFSDDTKDVIAISDLGCKSFNGENNFADYACPSGGRRARELLNDPEFQKLVGGGE